MLTRRYKGYVITEEGRVFKNGVELKGSVNNGYIRVGSKKNRFLIHEIMLPLFLNINTRGKCVHHIDENKLNNSLSNLRVMTFAEHARLHSIGRIETKEHKEKIRASMEKRKVKMLIEGYETTFNSVREASRKMGVNSGNITECCQGKRKNAGTVKTPDGRKIKIKWKYVED